MGKNPNAVALGRLAKGKTSEAKAKSSKKNGRLGGRPPKVGVRDWAPFMDAVDESRRRRSVEPFRELYSKSRVAREKVLIHSTIHYLCHEMQIAIPKWAFRTRGLREPWFVSGIENLKAMALVESPPEFKMNNIFVLSNFLSRV